MVRLIFIATYYILVFMHIQDLTTHAHSIFSIHFHLVFVTKYRHKAISPKILQRLKEVFAALCEKWGCSLIEFDGEKDHVHLLVAAHPNMHIANFINNLKTVSSRKVRKEFAEHIGKFYWEPVFWKKAYFIASAGGAPLELVKQYIQNQGDRD